MVSCVFRLSYKCSKVCRNFGGIKFVYKATNVIPTMCRNCKCTNNLVREAIWVHVFFASVLFQGRKVKMEGFGFQHVDFYSLKNHWFYYMFYVVFRTMSRYVVKPALLPEENWISKINRRLPNYLLRTLSGNAIHKIFVFG